MRAMPLPAWAVAASKIGRKAGFGRRRHRNEPEHLDIRIFITGQGH